MATPGIDSETTFTGQSDSQDPQTAGIQSIEHARESGSLFKQCPGGKSFSKTYKKVLEHYVGPTRQYVGLVARNRLHKNGKGYFTMVWDNNYQFIPYDTIIASITPKEYLQDSLFASAYRIKSHGFKLKVLDIQNMQTKNSSAGTQFMTNFIKDVPVQIWSDPELIFRMENILPQIDKEDLYDVNSKFQIPKPTSLLQGELKRCVIDLGKEWMGSRDMEPAVSETAYEIINDMNGMLRCENVQVGEEYSYNHDFPGDKWYPFGNFSDPRGLAQLKEKLDRTELPRSQTGPSFNYTSLLNDNFTQEPPPFMIKIDEILDDNGVIPLRGRIRCEYFTTVEYKTDPHMKFNSLNMGNRFAILAQRGIKNIYDQLRPSKNEFHYLNPNNLWAHGRFEYMEDPDQADRSSVPDDPAHVEILAQDKSFSDKQKLQKGVLEKLKIGVRENLDGELEMTNYIAPQDVNHLVDETAHGKDRMIRETINDLQATDSIPGVHIVQSQGNKARVLTEIVPPGGTQEKTIRKSLGVLQDLTLRTDYDKELNEAAEQYMKDVNQEFWTERGSSGSLDLSLN